MRIFCDFDGTISRSDTTDLILTRLADPEWETIEEQWVAGDIDAATCMSRQIPLLRAPLAAIDAILDTVELRDGFVAFLGWAQRRGFPVQIVSDGVDYFIHRILARHGIADVPVMANRLVVIADGDYRLEQPFRVVGCGSGVCKCRIVEAPSDRRQLVFVGDGRSDFCVANKPDVLFATAGLERHCAEQKIAHKPFTSFAYVQSALECIAFDVDALAAVA